MPGAAERFARELRRLRSASEVVTVACLGVDGPPHRLRITGIDTVEPCDHDVEAERVLLSVGGKPPPCVRLVELLPGATSAQLWSSIRGARVTDPDGTEESLVRLPSHVRCRLLAARLEDEFVAASPCVRESVAKLGLALLAPAYQPSASDVAKFQLTRSLPRWDTGPHWWSDHDLVVLHQLLRLAVGEGRPHLAQLPTEPQSRRIIATYAASCLDAHHLYTSAELAKALLPTFHNASRLVRLMLDEGTLMQSNGCFRTASSV